MPPLIRLFITRAIAGMLAGWVILALCLALDVFGLGGFVARSDHTFVALYAIALSFGPTFAAIAISVSVLNLAEYPSDPPNARLERWRKGGSAECDADRPLPADR